MTNDVDVESNGAAPLATDPATRVRLLKIVVQAHVVIDDGVNLREQVAQPMEVPAADLLEFPQLLLAKIAELELNTS